MTKGTAKRCEKCKRYAKKGSRFCSFHSTNGGRPVTVFSKSVKKRNIFELIDEAQAKENRSKLFDMTEDIASIQAIMNRHKEDVLAAMVDVEGAKNLRDASLDEKSAAYMDGFRPGMDDDEALAHHVAVTDNRATEAIERLVEKKSTMIERFYKTERNKAETYTIQQMGILVSYVSTVIRQEILDDAARKRIEARLELVPFDNILKGEVIEAIPEAAIEARLIEGEVG